MRLRRLQMSCQPAICLVVLHPDGDFRCRSRVASFGHDCLNSRQAALNRSQFWTARKSRFLHEIRQKRRLVPHRATPSGDGHASCINARRSPCAETRPTDVAAEGQALLCTVTERCGFSRRKEGRADELLPQHSGECAKETRKCCSSCSAPRVRSGRQGVGRNGLTPCRRFRCRNRRSINAEEPRGRR